MKSTCNVLALCCRPFRNREAGNEDATKTTRSSGTTSCSVGASSDSHPSVSTVGSAPPAEPPTMTREKLPIGASRVNSSGRNYSGDIFKSISTQSSGKLSSGASSVAELELGNLSHPANNLVEASSRRLADIECKREEDRKKTQRHVVSKFIKATATALREENKNYANNPEVAGLLHEEVVLITYDKMKFYGRKMVQKKINTGMEQMLSLISHMRSASGYLTSDTAEASEDGSSAADDTKAGENGAVGDEVSDAIEAPKELAPGLKVDGPNEVPGKDGMWAVIYAWKHGKTTVDFQETFTIVDYKIKKLKRGRA